MTQVTELRGAVLGKGYRLERPLGDSDNIHEARHEKIPGRFVVRLFPDDLLTRPESVSRVQRAARLGSALRDPHVVQLVDYNIGGEAPAFVVLEYVSGRSLTSLMREDGILPLPRVLDIVDALAAALDAGHRLGLVHGDMAPGHVFLPDGVGEPVARLAGFGWAKELRAGTRVPASSGYLAPEQHFGRVVAVDPEVDQFGLAALTYEMLAGCLPFSEESADLAEHHGGARIPPAIADLVPGSPAALDDVLRRALAADPDSRFANVIELAESLRAAAGLTVQRRRIPTQTFGVAPETPADAATESDVDWDERPPGYSDAAAEATPGASIVDDEEEETVAVLNLDDVIAASSDPDEKTVIRPPPVEAIEQARGDDYSDEAFEMMRAQGHTSGAVDNDRTLIRPSAFLTGGAPEPNPAPQIRRGPPPGRAGAVPRTTSAYHPYVGSPQGPGTYGAASPLYVPRADVPFFQPTQPPPRRSRGLALAIVLLTAIVVAGGGIAVLSQTDRAVLDPFLGADTSPPAAAVVMPSTAPKTGTTGDVTAAAASPTVEKIPSAGTAARRDVPVPPAPSAPAATQPTPAAPTVAAVPKGSPVDIVAVAELPKQPPSKIGSAPSHGRATGAPAASASRSRSSSRSPSGSSSASSGKSSWASSAGSGGSGDCSISITSRPWAELSIDGKATGQRTPVRDYKVPCGRHKLQLTRVDKDISQMEVITLERGKTFKESYELE